MRLRIRAIIVLLSGIVGSASGQDVTVSEAWVRLPAAGEASASAFVRVKNPTMYDIYLVSGESEVAGNIEFREAEGDGAKIVKEITVPAYGAVTMTPDGIFLVLNDLKRDLAVDEKIPLTLTTDGSMKLQIDAVVRSE